MGMLDFGGQQLFHNETRGTVRREHFIRFMDVTRPRFASTAPAVTMIILGSMILRWMV
jgi:hypothetical protein